VGPELQNAVTWLETSLAAHQDVVRRMQEVELTGCSPEFQAVYLEHARAWAGKAQAVDSLRETMAELAGATPTSSPALAQAVLQRFMSVSAEEKASAMAIRDTWVALRERSLSEGLPAETFDAATGGGVKRVL
jgi:phage head maturation protease